MSTEFPRIGGRTYKFETRELPSNSYANLGPGFGTFLPFTLVGDGGSYEHRQLNWTNLYLLNKLGHHIDEHSDSVIDEINRENDMEKIKQLIKRLPREILEHLEGHETEDQVKILNDLRRTVDNKIYDLRREIRDLKEDLREVKQGIRELREAMERSQRQPYY